MRAHRFSRVSSNFFRRDPIQSKSGLPPDGRKRDRARVAELGESFGRTPDKGRSVLVRDGDPGRARVADLIVGRRSMLPGHKDRVSEAESGRESQKCDCQKEDFTNGEGVNAD